MKSDSFLSSTSRSRFDLSQVAENGLRRGFTTGSCATAAVKAALIKLLRNESPSEIEISLPDEARCLAIPIDRIFEEQKGVIRAEVIKNGGDDPDQTHGARIFVRVKRNDCGEIRFLRGQGVGLVTQPGLQVAIGEPAINPVPRRMMINAVQEVFDATDADLEPGVDVEIGCENGEEIAKRTFNPRLGIEGGISILGTTGIVEPKSMAAFQASVEIYIKVALGGNPEEIVISPGNLGQQFARKALQLPLKRVVQMANFIGFALQCVEETLEKNQHRLGRLWVIGHPGKLAKVLDGAWDTHSQQSNSAVDAICRLGREFGFSETILESIAQSRTVQGVIDLLEGQPSAAQFWSMVEQRIGALVSARLARVEQVIVKLFQMDGNALGVTA